MKRHPDLYTIDSKGKVRTWRMEVDGNKFRTVAGIDGGNLVESGWTVAEAKSVGRANETTGAEQAELEVLAQYKKKEDKKYYRDRNKAAGSKFLECMLAHKYVDRKDLVIAILEQDFGGLSKKNAAEVETADGVFSQPKFDGMRCLASINGLMSRGGKPIVSVPHIMESLAETFEKHPDLVVDGELYNHDLKADFNQIMSLCKQQKPTEEDLVLSANKVQFHIYDSASIPGTFPVRFATLEKILDLGNEKKKLLRCLKHGNDCLRLARTDKILSLSDLDKLMGEYLEDGYEGQMVRLGMPYEGGRSLSLQKRKEFEDNEYKVIRIEEGKGNWAGCAKRLTCKLDDGREFGSGIRGTKEHLKKLLHESQQGKGPVTATVRHAPLTPDGIPRFGVAVDFQDKKGRWY